MSSSTLIAAVSHSSIRPQSDQKLQSLEGLRGLMALWVFATHYTTLAGFDLSKQGKLGFLLADGVHAVSVFILLSGFVIALLFARKQESYLPFITRRAFRLFPAYLFGLALSVWTVPMAVEVLQATPWPNEKTAVRLQLFADSLQYKNLHLLLHIPLLHGLVPHKVLPNSSYAFMGQAWSLSLEWQYYLIAPLLASLLYARFRRIGALLVVGVMAFVFAGHYTRQDAFILNNIHLFLGGMLTYRLYEYAQRSPENRTQVVPLLLLLGLLVAATDFRQTSIAVCIWVIAIFGELDTDGWSRKVRRFLSNRYSRWNGQSSYSFYCLHMVALYVSAFLLIRVWQVEVRWQYALGLLVLSLPATLLLSALSYRWIELPFIEMGKRVAKRLPH